MEPALVHAWLAARSVARGLPAPVAAHGGWCVETRTALEVRRFVFARPCPGLEALARSIREPGHVLKLCGTADELRAVLQAGWRLHAPGYFMTAAGPAHPAETPSGYARETITRAGVSEVRLRCAGGEIAARGFAAETREAFVYDRIETAPQYRGQGLGRCVMAALAGAKSRAGLVELLVATEAGRGLYETLGWRVLSPYATASMEERASENSVR